MPSHEVPIWIHQIYDEIPDIVEEPQEVVRRKEIDVLAMSESEAIEQMELLGHVFYMFLNENTNKINVLYKRDEGNYGVLIPQG